MKNNNLPLNSNKNVLNTQKLSKEAKEDLAFVDTSYFHANEKPSEFSNLVFFIIITIFISVITWSSLANIDELARGNGKIIPSDKIQTVQSLDGGIISKILVKEGEIVTQGQSLMKIDTTRFKATLEEIKQEYLSLLAVKVRLDTEVNINVYKRLKTLKFPKKVLEDKSQYNKIETRLLKSRFNELKATLRVLNNQHDQNKEELKEINTSIKNLKKSYKLIEEQKKTIRKLVRRGIKSKYDLLNIEKEYTITKGKLESATVSIKKSKLAILESKNKISEKIYIFKSEASMQLQKTVGLINKFKAKLIGDEDKVAKTTISSPVNGIIKNLNINTIGGVIQPGMTLAEIVPTSDILLVEAKISPKDIAFINPSQKAIVKLTAYDFSIYGGLDGEIVEISADSIIDKDSKEGLSYYRIIVKTNKNYLERHGKKLPIIPGMIASVDIVTGEKSILDFILKPILKVKQNSLHER